VAHEEAPVDADHGNRTPLILAGTMAGPATVVFILVARSMRGSDVPNELIRLIASLGADVLEYSPALHVLARLLTSPCAEPSTRVDVDVPVEDDSRRRFLPALGGVIPVATGITCVGAVVSKLHSGAGIQRDYGGL
jgi:hypothetical protein